MIAHSQLVAAIGQRVSRRAYLDEQIAPDVVAMLDQLVDRYNAEAELAMRLVLDDPAPFEGSLAARAGFAGVRNYLALAGPNNNETREKLGYYGELMVLNATAMRLGTCWVGGTYRKKQARVGRLAEGHKLFCVITLGRCAPMSSEEQANIDKRRARSKNADELCRCDTTPPEWFSRGMRAVSVAPSALNRQPVRIRLENGVTTAHTKHNLGFGMIDLGVAKANFAVAANCGTWEWGNGAPYTARVAVKKPAPGIEGALA